ncbi:hypothetical protein N8724_01385 [Candidatus Pelagibacter sp.]|nr:hypothetical protein [Candidatus Pelagibacter sp.]
MNIYIHLEVSDRELDSKILLAVLAAERGHNVMITDIVGFTIGLNNGLLLPGIFHTKSLTPSKSKIKKHQNIIDNGFKITSIDEEHGLFYDYAIFAKSRYSNKTIEQSSAVFGWGSEDTNTLNEFFPNHTSKIYKTGSPRADLWKKNFMQYWKVPEKVPKKPYILFASNMIFSNGKPFLEILRSEKKAGYYSRDPDLFKLNFFTIAEEYYNIIAFIEAIQHLSKHNNGYDIVVRPHPVENIEAWKTYLEDIPNVHVIRSGSITSWIQNSFAIMHNGCTSSLEAMVSEKPVFTYVTFDQKADRTKKINELGNCVKSPEELLSKVNTLFENVKSSKKNRSEEHNVKNISKFIYFDKNEMAAQKMIKIWESFSNNNLSQFSNWNLTKLKWILKSKKLKIDFGKIIRKLFLINKTTNANKIEKFPPLDFVDINERVRRLGHTLGIKKKLNCKFISERTFLIKKN